tara:strand:- start:1931 stop:2341 length:411 start_codon:yes stop_codon:yes gene_type:complete
MNTLTQLTALLAVTQAKYDQQQQSFGKLVSEENRLRTELEQLDAAARRAQTEPNGESEMRAIGADIIWQGWVARSKTRLNLKLAQVLALKLHQLAQVKQAYGKVLVIKELRDQARSKFTTKRAQNALAQAIDHTLF